MSKKLKENFKSLRILKNNIVFQFLEEVTANGVFREQPTGGGIIFTEGKATQLERPRWGEVICVGDDVDGLAQGDFIYIKSLQWTPRMKYNEEYLWMTDDLSVIAVTDDYPSLDV